MLTCAEGLACSNDCVFARCLYLPYKIRVVTVSHAGILGRTNTHTEVSVSIYFNPNLTLKQLLPNSFLLSATHSKKVK